MMEKRWCWICLVCGFVWVVKFESPGVAFLPEQCPSSRCRSRQWNGVKKVGRPRKVKEVEAEVVNG